MALAKRRKIVTEDIDLGHGSTTIPTDSGGTRSANKFGIYDLTNVFNVKDFGALGDGLSNDTIAITDAWTALIAAGGGTLYFPRGSYRTTSNLIFSVTGSVPRGAYIEGVPGVSVIKPSSVVTIAVTLATESNSDGYCNSLKMSGLRLDGVDTAGATGILVGENAGDLSAGITLEDVQVLRFAGASSKGINIRNITNARFTRVYVGRCGTNLHIQGDDVANALPTTILFENCQFREAKSSTGGTGRGVQAVRCSRASFRHCLFEANDKEGFYCVPVSSSDIVIWTELDECWCEGNQVAGSTSDYDIYADGALADTVMLRLANVNFISACRSIFLKSVHNLILDNIYPRSTANSVVISTACSGNILSWPQNNVAYATAVTNGSPSDVGFISFAPTLLYSTLNIVGTATFQSTMTNQSAIIGGQGSNLDLNLQPGFNVSGVVALRDYLGSNIANANTNRLAMDKRFAMALATVVAANDLTLPLTGNVFTVTGNTTINAITSANWQAGPVFLIFSGTPTVKHNTAGGAGTIKILLQGSVDLVAATSTVLMLVSDGTQWQEVSRKTAV